MRCLPIGVVPFPSSRSCPSGQKGTPPPSQSCRRQTVCADLLDDPRSTRSRLDVTNPASGHAAGLCQGGHDLIQTAIHDA